MIHSLSPAVFGRDTTTISRRRWLAAAGASVVTSLIGCDRAPPEQRTDRLPASGSSYGGDAPSPSPLVAHDDPSLLGRAVDWLWSKQARSPHEGKFYLPHAGFELPRSQDGSWRSEKYAQLHSGHTLTSFVFNALSRRSFELMRCPIFSLLAEDFLRRSVNAAGVVGLDDPELPEYPNYATSLALQTFAAQKRDENRLRIELMTKYLTSQQYAEATGFAPDHPAYGGWGFGGPKPVGGSPGHMDLGHTRHVLQALRAAGHDDPQTYARAEKFLRLLQKHGTPGFDGGFYFSPIVLAANKGGEETIDGKAHFRSYATATCDGILALLVCGVKPDDERITSAVAWLKKHPRLDYPEGVLEGTDTNWGASIRFYHFAVRAECYAALDWPGDWRGELRTMLAKLQQTDGSFINREGFLMKEDDPILCTALAVIALSQ